MKIKIKTSGGGYTVNIGNGILSEGKDLFPSYGKALIITDDGVPEEYPNAVANCVKNSVKLVLPHGEANKNADNYLNILKVLSDNKFCRDDFVIAVGGGVVGDISGFAAATYMRGIGFYNVPTTLLAQVDSSIGGKTGIDFCGFKNAVGVFYQPQGVIADTDCLKSLDERQFKCGLCEIVKMGIISDRKLFEMMEEKLYNGRISEIIYRSIIGKKKIVEKDEKEQDLRRVLNLGHTVGHAVESAGKGKYLHGECVGMALPLMCGEKIKDRVKNVINGIGIDTDIPFTKDELYPYLIHDKKAAEEKIAVVFADDIEKYHIEYLKAEELLNEKLVW